MQRFKNILFVATQDGDNRVALERAVTLAKDNQARLTVVEAVGEIAPNTKALASAPLPESLYANIVAEHQKELKELVSPWQGEIETQTKVLIGKPFLEIIRKVLCDEHDLVIKATQSGGFRDRVFGSDDIHLLRKCPCPVWLANSKSDKSHHRILAAVDVGDFYSPEELGNIHILNLQILELAGSLALSESAELHIIHVLELFGEAAGHYETSESVVSVGESPFQEVSLQGDIEDTPRERPGVYAEEVRQHHRQNLNALMDEAIGGAGQEDLEHPSPKTHLLIGSPRNKIPALVKEIGVDLVVMGTVTRAGISGYFAGNTAESIFNRLNCSVLAVKPPGYLTPITLEDKAGLIDAS